MRRLFFVREMQADLRSTKVRGFLFKMYRQAVQDRVEIARRYRNGVFGWYIISILTRRLPMFAVVVYVVYGLLNGQFESIGLFATLIAAAEEFNGQFEGIAYFIGELTKHAAYGGQVRSFFEFNSSLETQEGGLGAPEGKLGLELRGVAFRYPHSDFALRGVSLTIAPGEKIAIVGENGAGKSTLMKLLLRLYDIDGGEILYNGVRIREYNPQALRAKIGVAFQQPNAFALTLRENLQTYRKADDDVLRRALEDVGLQRLAGRLDSEVTKEFDEEGVMFSGGEAQKLGLARLLVGGFGLLLLDEPSSALDPLAERAVTRLMFEQADTATTIMVAHRLSTVRNADRIYLMDDGTIAEQGTHGALMELRGKYYEMFTKQAENYVG
jgi:ATP-binding cassette subfamily B protein